MALRSLEARVVLRQRELLWCPELPALPSRFCSLRVPTQDRGLRRWLDQEGLPFGVLPGAGTPQVLSSILTPVVWNFLGAMWPGWQGWEGPDNPLGSSSRKPGVCFLHFPAPSPSPLLGNLAPPSSCFSEGCASGF